MSETKQLELKIRKYSYVVRLDNGPKSAQMFEISDDSDMQWTAIALDESRAKLIVTAVNFHERLVEALREVAQIANDMGPMSAQEDSSEIARIANSLLSAISKAAE